MGCVVLPLRIGLKYCGGCNPVYDRVALVELIEKALEGIAEFVFPEGEDIDFILAVQGCNTCCADLTPFQGLKVRIITNILDGENFIKGMKNPT
jgi:hypothetical protein